MDRAVAPATSLPVLIVVSERPDLFAALPIRGHEVHRWLPRLPDGAEPLPGRVFVGDPADPRTYARIASPGRETVAVVDLPGRTDAGSTVQALRASHPDALILLLAADGRSAVAAGNGARLISWADLLRLDLDAALERLETQRRVERLREFAAGAERVPILIQEDPDPDGIASALAVRALLRRDAEAAPVVTAGRVTRPENLRMIRLLDIQVDHITLEELHGSERVIAVDVQPTILAGAAARLAVIDHHPAESSYRAEISDVRSNYGAAATILTEYLRVDDERRIDRRLATALLYGIQTDTALLTRGVTAADVTAYAFLQERADTALLRRIARPAYPESALRALGRALAKMHVDDELAVAHLGTIPTGHAHILADLADLTMSLEGVRWTAVAAVMEDDLAITLRYLGTGPGAGELARRLAGEGGAGGGHATMARVNLPGPVVRRRLGTNGRAGSVHAVRAMIRTELDRLD